MTTVQCHEWFERRRSPVTALFITDDYGNLSADKREIIETKILLLISLT